MEEKDKVIKVPESLIVKMQEQINALEIKVAEQESKNAGLEEMVAKSAETNSDLKLKEKKTFEPKFRTIKMRKYPIAGDESNLGYVIGWTNKGAYQDIDKSGIKPEYVDMIELIFLGQDKTSDGKIKAEKVKLLDFMNKGVQVHCKVLETKKEERKVATGEEINVSVFDPQHGLVTTGDTIDGYVCFSDISYKIQIPGHGEVWVDSLYANA